MEEIENGKKSKEISTIIGRCFDYRLHGSHHGWRVRYVEKLRHDLQVAIESGMDAHIAKPAQIETLKSTIRQVLNNHRT